MGTSAMADAALGAIGSPRPLLDGAGTRRLPDLCDDIAHALTAGHPTGESQMLLARTKALPKTGY